MRSPLRACGHGACVPRWRSTAAPSAEDDARAGAESSSSAITSHPAAPARAPARCSISGCFA